MSSPLVSVTWLAEHLGDADVIVVDCRWSLAESGRDAYAEGHIPGAFFADLDVDLSAPRGMGPGRHPLPAAEAFGAFLGRLGVTPSSTVVGYDAMGGAIAARLWWLLRYFGHGGGRVLDGGWPAWLEAGHPTTTAVPLAHDGAAPPLEARPDMVVDADGVAGRAPATLLLDARATPRYEGREEPVDPRAGHVPGARSAPFTGNLDGGHMRPVDDLRAHYAALGLGPATPVVAYCGSGVTACHDLLALALLGRDDARLYPGSWSDWSADPTRPVATGSEP